MNQDVSGTATPTIHPDHQFVVTTHSAANTASRQLAAGPKKTVEVGKGELTNAASWDDFPNGRFGDVKSPAYGDPNPWGTTNMTVRSHSTRMIR